MAALVAHPPTDFTAVNEAVLHDLGVESAHYGLGSMTIKGSSAQAPLTTTYKLTAVGDLTVHSTVHLSLHGQTWKVEWSPATIDPALGTNGHFNISYVWPSRAPVLASDGTPISPSVPTSVVIGLYGRYITNSDSLAGSLTTAGATAAEVQAAITSALASPTVFVPVFTVNWGRYEQLRPSLYPVPGVFFQSQGGTSSATPAPLVGVVGTLGAITKSELQQLGPPYDSSSIVGQGGVEQEYERQLAGTPGVSVTIVGPTGAVRGTVARVDAKAGTPVQTTIDLTDENDAAQALASLPNESALVAINVTTGQIIAAANSSQGSDLALDGAQPPGSTMKMITSTALIEKGLTPDSPATCPSQIVVDGEHFHNAEASEGPVPDLLSAFTVSCNTAFIGLTVANLMYTSLHDAANLYDLGGTWNPGVPVFTGSVPVNNGQTDFAASAIGQGRVLMSPLDLAMVAADLDTGTVRLPWITDGAPTEHAPTSSLPSDLVSDLHEMMLSVVESGTAAGTGLPSGTYAKTGTAETGAAPPLAIDAWLAGFNGDIAFAVLDVDAKGYGGPTDGPVAAKFLEALGL
jgi:cell division protein FtsI/penicillin-binding protein 2